jgi:hypothetical protein
MITSIEECAYFNEPIPRNCEASKSIRDAFVFSLSAITTTEAASVYPYLSNVSLLASLEAVIGIALTGLFGFVLGNKLRNS